MEKPPSNTPLINSLKEKGYKIKIRHFRPIVKNHVEQHMPYSRRLKGSGKVQGFGGLTIVALTNETGDLYVGQAICNKKDNFCYKEGTRRAIEDALGEMSMVK